MGSAFTLLIWLVQVAEPRRGHLHTRHLTAEEISLQPRSLEVFTQED